MKKRTNRSDTQPRLRVVYSNEEADQAAEQHEEIGTDDDQEIIARTDAFWAGRIPAARISARLSA